MAVNIGVNGVAREAKKLYIGVGGAAREVTKMYASVGGVARLVWPDFPDSVSTISFSNIRNDSAATIKTFKDKKWKIEALSLWGGLGGDVDITNFNTSPSAITVSAASMSAVLKTYLQSIGKSFSIPLIFNTYSYFKPGAAYMTTVTALVGITMSGNGISIDNVTRLSDSGQGPNYNPNAISPSCFVIESQQGDINFH